MDVFLTRYASEWKSLTARTIWHTRRDRGRCTAPGHAGEHFCRPTYVTVSRINMKTAPNRWITPVSGWQRENPKVSVTKIGRCSRRRSSWGTWLTCVYMFRNIFFRDERVRPVELRFDLISVGKGVVMEYRFPVFKTSIERGTVIAASKERTFDSERLGFATAAAVPRLFELSTGPRAHPPPEPATATATHFATHTPDIGKSPAAPSCNFSEFPPLLAPCTDILCNANCVLRGILDQSR